MQSSGFTAEVESSRRGANPASGDLPVPGGVQSSRETEPLPPNPAPDRDSASYSSASGPSALLEFSVLGLLLAGGIAMIRAIQMEKVADMVVCLLGSLIGCLVAGYLLFHRE